MHNTTRCLILLSLLLSGCSVLDPSAARIHWDHVSHPQVGPPFGPRTDEDSLDTLNTSLVWRDRAWFVEAGLGWRLADGGFYGPDLIFTSRVGREFSLE